MSFRHVYLPYCLQQLKDGRYIVLNRKYKPLGINSSDWVDYDSHPTAQHLKGLTAAKAKQISARGYDKLDVIHLYNDGCIPTANAENWAAYSKRLSILAELTLGD